MSNREQRPVEDFTGMFFLRLLLLDLLGRVNSCNDLAYIRVLLHFRALNNRVIMRQDQISLQLAVFRLKLKHV